MADAMPALLPRVLVFDLDGTLWAPEMYELWGGGAPFKRDPHNPAALIDCKGTRVELLGCTYDVLRSLTSETLWLQNKTILAVASACDEPEWAMECMTKLNIGVKGETLGDMMHCKEVYKASSKKVHFRRILEAAKRVHPSVDWSDFLFFDNQNDNVEAVSELGVTSICCRRGLTEDAWAKGLAEWRKNKARYMSHQ